MARVSNSVSVNYLLSYFIYLAQAVWVIVRSYEDAISCSLGRPGTWPTSASSVVACADINRLPKYIQHCNAEAV